MLRSWTSLPHAPGLRDSSSNSSGSSEMAAGLTSFETLSPELWSKLPQDVIRIIIHKVLVDLPFARHWSFCRDSSRWKDFFLSNRYLVYYQMGRCIIYNSRRGKWESASLEFCPLVRHEWFQHLRLVSVDGGLLTFFNNLNDQYFVCNLLTQHYVEFGLHRKLRKLSGSATVIAQVHISELMSTTLRSPAAARSLVIQPFLVYHGYIEGGNEKPFQLITSRQGGSEETLLIKDPRFPSIMRFDIHSRGDFWFIVNGPTLDSPQVLIVGFATDPEAPNLLIYDLRKKRCRWTTTQTLLQAIERTGKVLAICSDREAQMKFFEVDGTGLEMKMVESPSPTLPPSLQSVCETLLVPKDLTRWQNKRHELTLVCSAEGDSVDYFVASVSSENRLYEIWVCNDAQQQWHHISNWTSRGPPPTGIMHPHDLYVFKPSAAGPRGPP